MTEYRREQVKIIVGGVVAYAAVLLVAGVLMSLVGVDKARGEARGYVSNGQLVIKNMGTSRYGFKETTRTYKDVEGRTVTETIIAPLTEPVCPRGVSVLRYGVRGC